jgi:DNA-binding transcriptional LysR family regulator
VHLQQLEHFLAIAEEGSMTRAAARLHFAQSSLSSSIRALEAELDATLFTRTRAGMRLNDAGEALLPAARRILTDVEQARDAVAGVRGLLRGTVRLGSIPTTPAIDLCSVLTRFSAQHPQVTVQVVYDSSAAMLQGVSQGALDFAIAPRTCTLPPHLEFHPILPLPLTLICHIDHPLAREEQLMPQQIPLEDVLDLPASWALRQLFDLYLGRRERRPRLELDGWEELTGMVERGFGIGYSPTGMIDGAAHPRLAACSLKNAPQWELGIAVRRGGPTGIASKELMDAFRRFVSTVKRT